MQLLISGLKSNKIATLVGIALAITYLVPDFIDSTREVRTASYGVGKQLFAKAVPLPPRKPSDIPAVDQPDQFDMESLNARLSQVDYRLSDVRRGEPVPRFYVEQMPVDILDIPDVEERKRTFIKLVLPLILNVNEKIAAQRSRLATLVEAKSDGKSLRETDRKWLDEIAIRYRAEESDPESLLLRVDEVPVSLAIAQAVEESGWGTSRFAREGNALFGQRVWATGKGLVPEDRDHDESHEVKSFKSIAESIRAYIHNLNSHPAYEDFRQVRARQHLEPGFTADAMGLIDTLHVYSEKGVEYVNNLRSLIEMNRLDDFEDAELAPERFADSRR